MQLSISLLLLGLAGAQWVLTRGGALRRLCFWLLNLLVVAGCTALLFGTLPLQFGFLRAGLFWQNMAAFVAATGLLLLLAPVARTPGAERGRQKPEPGADAATETVLCWLNLTLCVAAGGGGLACLWLGGRGALPAESWQALTGYCLLWLLPLALRQGLWLLHTLRHPAALHSENEVLNRHFTKL